MGLFFTSLFWFTVALLWAIAEIEIEGKYGWAERSQTWFRVASRNRKNFFLKVIMAGKPLTGYHLPIFALVFLIAHSHFFMGVPWSLTNELTALAIYFSWPPLWDNLWFLFNPNFHFGMYPEEVWWYKRWVFKTFPIENIFQWFMSIIIVLFGSFVTKDENILKNQLFFLGYLAIFGLVATIFLAPVYKKWYIEMRKHDDRNKLKKIN